MAKSIAVPGNLIDLERLERYDEHAQARMGKSIAAAKADVVEEIQGSIEEKVDQAIGDKLDDGAIQEKVTEAVDQVIGEKFSTATDADIDNMFEVVKLNLRPMDEEDAQVELGGHELGDLVGEDFNAVLSDNKITVTGTINKVEGWSAAFPAESQETDYYIPLILFGAEGSVVQVQLLAGGTKDNVFGQTGDSTDMMRLVLAVTEAEPTRTFTVFANASEASEGDNGRVITVDASKATFIH